MVQRCVVRGCGSEWHKGTHVIYHAFPKNSDRRKLWLKVPFKTKFYESARICSLHFNETDYGITGKHLKLTAIPFSKDGPSLTEEVPNKSQSQKNTEDKEKQQFDPFREYANDSTDEDSPELTQEKSDGDSSDEDQAERGAPVTEKVFLTSVPYKEKQSEDDHSPSKRARWDTSEVSFDYTEELYEFGKFVAEQLMCLDVEEARVAQTVIREVLSKFLMNKTMRRSAQPSTSNVQPLRDDHYNPTSSQGNPAVSSITKSRSTVNTSRSTVNTAQSVFTHVNIFGPSVDQSGTQNTALPSVTKLGSQKNTASSSMTQSGLQKNNAPSSVTLSGLQKNTAPSPLILGSQKNTAPSAVTLSGSQKNTALSSVTQAGSQISISGPSGQSGLILQPSLTRFAVLNPNPSPLSAAQCRYVIMPAPTVPAFNLSTQVGNTEGKLLTQIRSVVPVGSLVTHSGSSHVLRARTPLTQSGSSNVIYCRTSVKTKPESEGNVIPPSVTENESLIIKSEPDSEEET